MNDNFDKGKSAVKIKGLVWKVKVRVHFMKNDEMTEIGTDSKNWKIKEFLN